MVGPKQVHMIGLRGRGMPWIMFHLAKATCVVDSMHTKYAAGTRPGKVPYAVYVVNTHRFAPKNYDTHHRRWVSMQAKSLCRTHSRSKLAPTFGYPPIKGQIPRALHLEH